MFHGSLKRGTNHLDDDDVRAMMVDAFAVLSNETGSDYTLSVADHSISWGNDLWDSDVLAAEYEINKQSADVMLHADVCTSPVHSKSSVW